MAASGTKRKDPKKAVAPIMAPEGDVVQEHFIPEARLIAALVNEVARSRARHRALLDVLERSGVVDISQYVDEYRTEEIRDFVPFVDLLLLRKHEFEAKHPTWIAENLVRFGYDGSARPQLSFEGTRQTTVRQQTDAAPPKPRSRARASKKKS